MAYASWLEASPTERHLVQLDWEVPLRYEPIEGHFYPRLLAMVPTTIREAIVHEATYGVKASVADLMFRMLQVVQPSSLSAKDSILAKLTSPNPCRDPQAPPFPGWLRTRTHEGVR